MKKFAKMSLVAALAVTGTVATAQPLAEAIKNVDVSGTVVYRYNDYNQDENDNGVNEKANYYKAVMNLKSKVNDDVSANISIAANNNMGAWDTRSTGDSNVDVQLTKVNFAYTGVKNTTVVLGKQGIPTPWTVASDSDGAEQTGTGALALSTWGPVTFAGAYFNQTNFDDNKLTGESGESINGNFGGEEDVITFGIMANIGPVSIDAWYLDLTDDNDNADTTAEVAAKADVSFDSYTVGASYGLTVADVKLDFKGRYTSLDFDDKDTAIAINRDSGDTSSVDTENELWYVGMGAKMGIFGASVLYGETGQDGGLVALDGSAKTAVESWNVSLNGQRDATLIKTNINAQVLPSLNIALNYNDIDSDYDDKQDREELYTQITYKMSKNFSSYVRLGQFKGQDKTSGKDIDSDVGRLQIQYSF